MSVNCRLFLFTSNFAVTLPQDLLYELVKDKSIAPQIPTGKCWRRSSQAHVWHLTTAFRTNDHEFIFKLSLSSCAVHECRRYDRLSFVCVNAGRRSRSVVSPVHRGTFVARSKTVPILCRVVGPFHRRPVSLDNPRVVGT